MNDDVRAEFQARRASTASSYSARATTRHRAGASSSSAPAWPAECSRSGSPNSRPSGAPSRDLDLVLTHVDDRFDTGMRDAIGADAARVLPLLDTRSFTFLIEDPATVWHLGAQRYPDDRGALPGADAAHGQAGHRPEYRRALPGCLPHQAADRHRAVPAGASRGGEFRARGAVFRELAAASGSEAAAGRGGRRDRASSGSGPRRWWSRALGVGIAVAGRRPRGRPALAGAGRRNRLAAGGGARRGAGAGDRGVRACCASTAI